MTRAVRGRVAGEGLGSSLEGLPGVGPRTAERLSSAGLRTRADALNFIPRRWDDLRAVTPMAALVAGQAQTTRGEVRSARVVFGRRRFFEAVFVDEGGARLSALWFHFRGGLKERFAPGRRFLISGTPRPYKGGLQMAHPETLPLDAEASEEATAGIRVRYPEIEGVPGTVVARMCRAVAEAHANEVLDGLPEALVAERKFPSEGRALAQLHTVGEDAAPEEIAALNRGLHPAQRRLAYDELFFVQLGLARRRAERTRSAALACDVASSISGVERFLVSLPFSPTKAQRRAVDEIARDLSLPHPMHRLLQGDVGAGKTVVMFAAAEIAMASGFQVAVMAPTEILAEQHARTLAPWAKVRGRRLALLTSSLPRVEAEAARNGLATGEIDLVVGTHALIAERVGLARLGLAIIDEQHRFGVAQRAALREKARGRDPHLLVMTATPIPRTLALTLYGDLDVTTLDELPPGRVPPETILCLGARGRKKAYASLAKWLGDGHQGYVVCPHIDSTDDDRDADAGSAVATRDRLAKEMPGVEVGLVHGRLSVADRDAVMSRFRAGTLPLLVATTVIEVGVDVPSAGVMLIEGAERFGLAQLHQLRGRIGRGGERSLCILVSDGKGDAAGDAKARLATLEETSDGFAIAEADLKLRGPGEVYGTRQAGMPRLRFADLSRDLDLLQLARRDAFAILDRDPMLAQPAHAAARSVLQARWAEKMLFGEETG